MEVWKVRIAFVSYLPVAFAFGAVDIGMLQWLLKHFADWGVGGGEVGGGGGGWRTWPFGHC